VPDLQRKLCHSKVSLLLKAATSFSAQSATLYQNIQEFTQYKNGLKSLKLNSTFPHVFPNLWDFLFAVFFFFCPSLKKVIQVWNAMRVYKSWFLGVYYFFKFTFQKTFADNLLTRMSSKMFFSRKEMKVFDENIPAFFSIMHFNGN